MRCGPAGELIMPMSAQSRGRPRKLIASLRPMRIDIVNALPGGAWSVGVHDAQTSQLVRAFDPGQPFIVLEGHSPGGGGWQRLAVPLAATEGSLSTHRVRGMRFDLLLTPDEALEVADALDVPFPDGGLFAWQTPTEPPSALRLLGRDHRARASASKDVGVTLMIDQPHAEETAVLWSPTQILLEGALDRLLR